MTHLRRTLTRMVWLMALLLLGMSSLQAQGNASVRFAHVVPDAPPIDVYINNSLTATGIDYGTATNYISVPAGDHSVTVTPAGTQSTLWAQTISVGDGSNTTFIASSADAPQFTPFEDNLTARPLGGARLLLVHALAEGPAVNVELAREVELNGTVQEPGTPLAQDMAYDTSVGSFDIPAQEYVVNVVPSGGSAFDVLLSELSLSLATGTSYMAVVHGTADNPQALLLSAPTAAGEDSGFVRFVHGVVGVDPVDVLINDALVIPGLSIQQPTEHIALPAGDHTVSIQQDGDEVLTADLTVTAGAAQTVAALPGDPVTVGVFADDISGVTADTAAASVINAVPNGSVSVSVVGNDPLASELASGSASNAVTFDPTQAPVEFSLTIDGQTGDLSAPEQTFYGGVYYNLIVLPGSAFSGPQLIVSPTALAQSLTSAPGDVTLADTTGGETTDTDSETVPAEQATTAPTEEAPATQAPVDEDAVTARVVLDPSANLQLRQFPSADALSLGLAPSGTVLEVNGREGRPVELVEGQGPPPEAEEYVDPATQLESEDDDLDPQETWLNVTYETPDGGEINAWVLSQYLDVRDPEGDLQRLADLEPIGRNIPGEAVNTELTPPPIPEDRVTGTITNLNPGSNLNIRRTPTTSGEVLERVANGTAVEILGFVDSDDFSPENAEWVFIQYTPAEGGTITGWVSTNYIEYSYRGRDVDVNELFEREVVNTITADRRGEVGGGAQTAPLPTPDPLEDAYVGIVNLNPGANLQFRISPDASSESLNLIPSGTQLIIDARTSDSEWVQTTFEGETGWVASQYLNLSFNGETVEVTEIPVAAEADDTTDDGDDETSDENNG